MTFYFQSVIGWPAYKNSIASQLDIDGLTTWLDPGQARLMQVKHFVLAFQSSWSRIDSGLKPHEMRSLSMFQKAQLDFSGPMKTDFLLVNL